MADAGRAMMLYRGMYDSTYTYEKLDVVNFNGSLYISTTDGNLGTEPTDGTKWKLFLQGGVSDNIQATDTYGLVGEAGGSSFVQSLLDAMSGSIKNIIDGTTTVGNADTATKAIQDENGRTINGTYLPYNGYFAEDIPINEITTPGIYRTWRPADSEDADYLGFSGHIWVMVTENADRLFQIIFGMSDNNARNHLVWRINTTRGDLSFTYDTQLQTLNYSSTPPVTDNSTRIATTEWVKQNILNTVEEIDASTSANNIAGASAVKELKRELIIYEDIVFFNGTDNVLSIPPLSSLIKNVTLPSKDGYTLLSCQYLRANGGSNGVCIFQIHPVSGYLLVFNTSSSATAGPYNITFRCVYKKN